MSFDAVTDCNPSSNRRNRTISFAEDANTNNNIPDGGPNESEEYKRLYKTSGSGGGRASGTNKKSNNNGSSGGGSSGKRLSGTNSATNKPKSKSILVQYSPPTTPTLPQSSANYSYNLLTTIPPLPNYQNLLIILLSHNGLTEFEPLISCVNAVEIDVSYNCITGVPGAMIGGGGEEGRSGRSGSSNMRER